MVDFMDELMGYGNVLTGSNVAVIVRMFSWKKSVGEGKVISHPLYIGRKICRISELISLLSSCHSIFLSK